MKTSNKTLLSSLTTGGSVATTSNPICVQHIYTFAIQTTATGASPAGTVQVQASCDPFVGDETGANVANWANVGTPRTLSAAGSFIDNLDGIGYNWVRVIYTANSGTGTVTSIQINCKGS